MKKIFVVDDNKTNLLTVKEALWEFYDVFTMPSAAVMFNLLKNITPDLFLLDILMPEVTGFDILKQLKADGRYASIPVIFLTSKNDPETKALGYETGVSDFIPKPFTKTMLLDRIRKHLA